MSRSARQGPGPATGRTTRETPAGKRRMVVYTAEVTLSLLIVCGLFWLAFAYHPTVKVKKIERFPFERRDAFYSVTALDDAGRSVCAVGSYGKIVRSEDGGATWSIQKNPIQAHLQKVVAWDPKSLLAVGDKGAVLITADGGQNWQPAAIPTEVAGEQLLSAEIERASGRAWVVGGMGTVLVSEDRGKTWSSVHPREDVSWNDVAIAGDGSVWVAGEFGNVRRSGDYGRSWEPVPVPTESSINAVAFADATRGVMVGLSGTVLVTADGGRNWNAAASGARTHLYDLLWDGTRYRAVGDAGMILTAGADGAGWEVVKLAAQNYGWYTGISRVGDGYFVVGVDAGIYRDGKWFPFAPGQPHYKKERAENG